MNKCGITGPPLDLRLILPQFKLIYIEAYLPIEVEAMILPYRGHACAFINIELPESRYRFAIAHQFYHYYFEGHPYVRERSVKHVIPPGFGSSRYQSELDANTFATELLVPHFMLRNHFLTAGHAEDVALKFRVSKAVADFAISRL